MAPSVVSATKTHPNGIDCWCLCRMLNPRWTCLPEYFTKSSKLWRQSLGIGRLFAFWSRKFRIRPIFRLLIPQVLAARPPRRAPFRWWNAHGQRGLRRRTVPWYPAWSLTRNDEPAGSISIVTLRAAILLIFGARHGSAYPPGFVGGELGHRWIRREGAAGHFGRTNPKFLS